MATIMRKVRIKMNTSTLALRKLNFVAISLGLLSYPAFAEFRLEGSVESELIYQNIDSNSLGTNDIFSLQLKPVVGALLKTNSVDGYWVGSVTHLQREGKTAPDSDTFPEYQYNVEWEAIENILTFSGQGGLQYRATNAADFIIADYLNSSDTLTKAQNDRVGARITLLKGDWVKARGNVGYSVVEADESPLFNDFALDSENYVARGQLSNGDEAKRVMWDVRGSYQKSMRNSKALSDFVSTNARGYVDTLVVGNFGVRLNTYYEEHDVSESTDVFRNNDEFTSYGAGVVYRRSQNRYIAVTINEAESNNAQIDGDQYVGVDLKWALSPRTSIAADIGKNAYGSRAKVDFEYATKYTSAKLTYNDRITNTSRLLTEDNMIGVFICPIDVGSLNGCSPSTNLDYLPSEGEQVVPILEELVSLEEEIILRESLIGQFGYYKGKLQLELTLQHSEDQLLEQELDRETSAIITSARYRLNSRMDWVNSFQYVQSEQQTPLLANAESDSISLRTGIDRYLNPRLFFQTYITYLDKNGNYGGGRYGSDYSDLRLSVGVRYLFN